MKKQALTAIEIETPGMSNSAATDERQRPVSNDSGAYTQEPETLRRSTLRRLIDCFALASCSMAGVYVGVWLDPPNDVARADSPPTANRVKQHHD
jgi:hypothetical protein